jgi:hypothetical protein
MEVIVMERKSPKPRIFVAGTRDRLFVVRSMWEREEGKWLLVDRRRNAYFHGLPEEILDHIEVMVSKGEYELRPKPPADSSSKQNH